MACRANLCAKYKNVPKGRRDARPTLQNACEGNPSTPLQGPRQPELNFLDPKAKRRSFPCSDVRSSVYGVEPPFGRINLRTVRHLSALPVGKGNSSFAGSSARLMRVFLSE